jgi:hypothetical protein
MEALLSNQVILVYMSTISYRLTSAKSSGSADADAYHNKIADNMLGAAVRDWYGCNHCNKSGRLHTFWFMALNGNSWEGVSVNP